jgi:hypothetical protein
MPNFRLESLLVVWVEVREGALGELRFVGVNLDFVQERRVVLCLLLERRRWLLSADRSFFSFSSEVLGQPPNRCRVAAAPLMRRCLKSPNGRRVDLSGLPGRWHRGMDLSLSFFSGLRITERSISVVVVLDEGDDVLELEVLVLVVAVLAVASRDIGVVKEVVTQNVVEGDVWHLLLR